MTFRVPLSTLNASDGNVTYAQGSVLRVGAGGNVNAIGSVIVDASGNMGIGGSPTSALDVISSSTAGNLPFLSVRNTSGATGGSFGPGIIINNGVAGTHGYIIQQTQSAVSDFTISNQVAPFTNYISIAQAGNVTIASNVSP